MVPCPKANPPPCGCVKPPPLPKTEGCCVTPVWLVNPPNDGTPNPPDVVPTLENDGCDWKDVPPNPVPVDCCQKVIVCISDCGNYRAETLFYTAT